MSATPKTDSFELDYATTGGGWGRPFDFARELERKTVTQAETIRRISVDLAARNNELSDIAKILGDENMPGAEIIKGVEKIKADSAHYHERFKWWMKNAEALTAERNELMNAGSNHAEIAARMKREIAEFFASPNRQRSASSTGGRYPKGKIMNDKPDTPATPPTVELGSSDLFGEGSGCVERVRANVHRLEGRGGEDVRGLLTIIDRLRAELAEERDASEVERVVDAMTPEQVESYIVKMGGDITEVRARGQKLRAKIAAQMEGDGPVSNATARAYLAAYPSDAGFCPESMEAALRWGHRMYASLRAIIENEEKKSTADGWLLNTARAALSSPNQ